MSLFELFTPDLAGRTDYVTVTASVLKGDGREKLGADLAAFHDHARSTVLGTWAASDSSKAAVLGALEADRKRIARLRTGDLANIEFSRWNSIAKSTHEDIAAQVGFTTEWSVKGVVSAATAASIEDGKKLGGEIAAWAPYVLGVVGLVAVAYLAGPFIRNLAD